MRKVVILGDTLINNEPLGIQRFAYEILREVDLLQKDYQCELVIPENAECRLSFSSIQIVRYGRRNGFLWRQLDFPNYVKKQKAIGVDLTLALVAKGCSIIGIYDCIYESYKEDFSGFKAKLKRLSYLLRAKLAIRKAQKIVTISEFSRNEIHRYYKVSDDKIAIVNCAWQHMKRIESDNSVLCELGLAPKSYCFALGSSLPHKNFKWIVAAAAQNPELQFVVTGTNRLSNYSSELNIDNISNVIFTGYLSDGKVKALMENCYLFLHPSLLEGFGIPPMEAMSCGAEVLISDSSCLPEIYGKSVHYFNPHKYDNININEIVSSDVEADSTVLERYSWIDSAKKINDILNSIV